MLSKLQRLMNRARIDDSDGFTLIELLIVVVIIGILAAIAIPQFSSTKESAYEATIKSDLRNSMTELETMYAKDGNYPDASDLNGGDELPLSSAVTYVTYTGSSGSDEYCLELEHNSLTNNWAVGNSTSTVPTGGNPGTPVEGNC